MQEKCGPHVLAQLQVRCGFHAFVMKYEPHVLALRRTLDERESRVVPEKCRIDLRVQCQWHRLQLQYLLLVVDERDAFIDVSILVESQACWELRKPRVVEFERRVTARLIFTIILTVNQYTALRVF